MKLSLQKPKSPSPTDDAYEKYITSDAWKKRRDRVFKRDGLCCVICNSPNDLQAHHRTYERFGKERLEDLTTLCIRCHRIVTSVLRGRRKITAHRREYRYR